MAPAMTHDDPEQEALRMVCSAAARGENDTINEVLGGEHFDSRLVDGTDMTNLTPLGAAAMNGHASTIELLIDKFGVSVDAMNCAGLGPVIGVGWFDGYTALELALENGHVEACHSLLIRGAEDPTGEAALLAGD